MTDDETLLKFPCDFILKVFGLDTVEFETEVLIVIRKYVTDLKENSFTYRRSKDNKYLSITVRMRVTSKEQLDNIYRELSSNPQVLMVL